MDRVSMERMCAGREFQVEGADTEKARDEKLLVSLLRGGLVRRFVLEERKTWYDRTCEVCIIGVVAEEVDGVDECRPPVVRYTLHLLRTLVEPIHRPTSVV